MLCVGKFLIAEMIISLLGTICAVIIMYIQNMARLRHHVPRALLAFVWMADTYEDVKGIIVELLGVDAGKVTKETIADAQTKSINFYEEWLDWDKKRALSFCIQSFKRSGSARKASKAALLAAILFQKYNFDIKEERLHAETIIDIFRDNPEYMPILKAYAEVFQYDKESDLFSNLMKFMDFYDIDVFGKR